MRYAPVDWSRDAKVFGIARGTALKQMISMVKFALSGAGDITGLTGASDGTNGPYGKGK
jgi:hypothetical protein